MYEKFFGLRECPFDLTPNPKYLYLTGKHREALSNLQYGIAGRKGVTVLVGEAGTGKTTIVRAAIDALAGPGVRCIYVSNPVLTRVEFYEFLAPRFGLSERAALSKAQFLFELEDSLLARCRAGGTTALIVDEAQSLPHDLMEEVRLLANFETPEEKVLQVVLAGQPELAERLEHEGLRQLKQRVALRCELVPLDLRETASYIAGRIAIAGGEAPRIFTREAVGTIHDHARGIPRTISVICDNAMVTAFAAGQKPIGSGMILDVCRDFHLSPLEGGEARPVEEGAPPDVAGRPRAGRGYAPGNGNQKLRDVVAPPSRVAPPRGSLPGQRMALDIASVAKANLPSGSSPAAVRAPASRPPEAMAGKKVGDVGRAEPKSPLGQLFGLFSKKKRFPFF